MNKAAIDDLKNDLKALKFSDVEKKLFVLVFLAILVAKGIALLPLVLSHDDYTPALFPEFVNPGLLAQGRYSAYLVRVLHARLGLDATYANPLIGMLSFASLAWAAVITSRLWRINDRLPAALLAGLMMCLHPYTAPQFTFKVSTVFYNFFFGYLGLYLARFRLWHMLSSIVLIVFVLGKNQTIVNYFLVTIIIACILAYLRLREGRCVVRDLGRALAESELIAKLVAIGTSIVIALSLAGVIRVLVGIAADQRGRFIGPDAIGQRIHQVFDLLWEMLLHSEAGQPLLVKLLAVVLLVLAVLALIRRAATGAGGIRARLLSSLLMLVLLLAAWLSVFAVTMPLASWTTTRRVLFGFGIFMGGIAVISYLYQGRAGRRLVIALSSLLVVAYMAANNHLLTDQMVVNLRDFHRANRILGRLEAEPGFASAGKLIVLGGDDYEIPGESARGDYGSMFTRPWNGRSILHLISGYRFDIEGTGSSFLVPSEAADIRLAEEYCKNHPLWPSRESTAVVGDLAIVCLLPHSGFSHKLGRERRKYVEITRRHHQQQVISRSLALAGHEPAVTADGERGIYLVFSIAERLRRELRISLRGSTVPGGQALAWEIEPVMPFTSLQAGKKIVVPVELANAPAAAELSLQMIDSRTGAPYGRRIGLGVVDLDSGVADPP
jgi:hypothetical protein